MDKSTRKKVVKDLSLSVHKLESNASPLSYSTDDMGRPVLVLFQGKVPQNSRDR